MEDADVAPEPFYPPTELYGLKVPPGEDPFLKALNDQNKAEAKVRDHRRSRFKVFTSDLKAKSVARGQEYIDRKRMIMINGKRLPGINAENFNMSREEIAEIYGEDAAKQFVADKATYNRDINTFGDRWQLAEDQKHYGEYREEMILYNIEEMDNMLKELDPSHDTRRELYVELRREQLENVNLEDRLAKKNFKLRALKADNKRLRKFIDENIMKSNETEEVGVVNKVKHVKQEPSV